MKVAIVTPTIGSKHLKKCIDSVDKQSYENITHYIFIDGIEHFEAVENIAEGASKTKIVALEENVGKGWYGHRVYAACSFLVNADVIVYLDEDNWIDRTHIETLVDKLNETNAEWVYSLRNIYEEDGQYVCQDNCESLGKWPTFFDEDVYHIDTSCFAVRRDVAVKVGHSWYGQWGADRQFFHTLKKHFPNYVCTNQHTVNYRLGGNEGSVKKDFFLKGNKLMSHIHTGDFPWLVKEHLLLGDQVTLVLT
jgi:glycosyltransferase involved in cell wall biosynthesis